MICKMCSTGADMQQRANELKEETMQDIQFSRKKLRSMGLRLHQFCKGCDCQHKGVSSGTANQSAETA